MMTVSETQPERAPRVPLCSVVKYHSVNRSLTLLTHDLSSSGIFLPTTTPDEPGTTANLEIHSYVSREPIQIQTRVARTGTQPCPGMGLSFLNVKPKTAAMLRTYWEPLRRNLPRVLLIDDDPTLMRMVGRVLHPEGLAFVGLDPAAVTAERIARFEPSVLLIDVMMPGQNGYTMARSLRTAEALAKVRMVFYTATVSGVPPDLNDIPVLTKGCSRKQLIAALKPELTLAVAPLATETRDSRNRSDPT